MNSFGAVVQTSDPIDIPHFHRWSAALAEQTHHNVSAWTSPDACLAHSGSGTEQLAASVEPLSLDGRVWIAADARIDDQAAFVAALRARGRRPAPEASDAALILHGYAAWGVECVDHLLGDFSFALWDAPERRLFAARDQLGAKPLYYAQLGSGLLVSNDAAALFRHPAVDCTLDDQTIVDFLTLEEFDSAATPFRGVRRLPAAHRIVWADGHHSIHRWWTLPVEEPMSVREARDAPRVFVDLARTAIVERLRGEPASMGLSGGLDSTTVAVIGSGAGANLRALTASVSSLLPELEQPLAAQTAALLRIPLESYEAPIGSPYEGRDQLQRNWILPQNVPFDRGFLYGWELAARLGRVYLTGFGPDATLLPEPIVPGMRGPAGAAHVLAAVARHIRAYGRRPPLGVRRGARAGKSSRSIVRRPSWLREPLFHSYAREHRLWAPRLSEAGGSRRPVAHSVLSTPYWQHLLESNAVNASSVGLAISHPLMDLRVVRFCLRLPSTGWCWDKHLLRRAIAGSAPAEVVRRRKTALPGDPLRSHIERYGSEWAAHEPPADATRRYCSIDTFAALRPLIQNDDPYVNARPLVLDAFLRAWLQRSAVQ